MIDILDEPTQLRGASGTNIGRDESADATVEQLERPSFAARVRMIILLSLICWAALFGIIAWIIA